LKAENKSVMTINKKKKEIPRVIPSKTSSANLIDMPPILARVINPLPDYCHDHLVFMTARELKNEIFVIQYQA